MTWCFSTRASVAAVLTTHPCVSRCLRVNILKSELKANILWAFSNAFSWQKFLHFVDILLHFVPMTPTDKKSATVDVMAWQQTGNMPLDRFMMVQFTHWTNKQRVLMHGHQGWNVRHGLCHIYMRYVYIYELFIAFVFLLFVHYCNLMVCVVYWVGKWRSRGSTGMFGNLMAIYHIMLQFIQNHYKSTFS